MQNGEPNYAGRRATVMGLGRHGGGVAAVRFLARRGAVVTVTDLADEDSLSDSLAQLADVSIAGYCLGRHRDEDFAAAELVVVNPAVRPGNRLVESARAAGAEVTTEIDLLLAECPARIAAVTGSNGKSTTAVMLAEILGADGRRCWLGGNIGVSLLPHVDEMRADDWVVLELSSFQLAQLARADWGPQVAIVTGCTPNHLDWHGSFDAYRAAKRRLLAGQSPVSVAVLNPHDGQVARWGDLVRGRLLEVVDEHRLPPLAVPGPHNRRNAALAATAALEIGCSESSVRRGLADFAGLPHRLQPIGSLEGRKFYDDSKSTTPEATIAALAALAGRAWLLAGGQNKGAAFVALGEAIARGALGACFFGAAGGEMLAAARAAARASPSPPAPLECVETLGQAVQWAWRQSRPGEAILLSPACASFDQFRDYVHRGEVFAARIRELA